MNRIFLIIITIILFVIPFFWFKPGEMDLGGDDSRLYFYDPISFFRNLAFYGVSPSGFGNENIGYFFVQFVLMLTGLKSILSSTTILISFLNGMSLSIAFLSCYGIIKNLLDIEDEKKKNIKNLAGIIAGITYIFSPASIYGWDKVFVTHNQFFLNPLMFLLLLLYVKTSNFFYLAISLLVTFLFSPNFSFAAAPGFFAFYPLSLLFLTIYRVFILHKKIIWKHIISFSLIFLLLQSFHLIPQVISLFSPGSVLNTAIFNDSGKLDRGLGYFTAIAPSIKVSINLFNLPQMTGLVFWHYLFIILPIIITVGLLFSKSKTVLLTTGIFLIVLFFASANITNIGFDTYKKLFNLPGFSMFRNFYGQWQYSFLFFYTILFSQTLAFVLIRLNKNYRYIICFGLIVILVAPALHFINGNFINKQLWGSNMKIFMQMDPKYEEAVTYMRSLPVDGKVLTLPLTDPGYQIVAGKNNGAYQGPSTVSYLAGKQDFAGLAEFGDFKEYFEDLVKNREYKKLKELLGMLNIKYIFYNSDPRVYDKAFPGFPYTDVREILPANQSEYKKFLKELSAKEIKAIDNKYFIFEIDNTFYQPKFFTSSKLNNFSNPINNWAVPLTFEKHESFVFSELQPSSTPDIVFAELEVNSIFPKIIKNPNPPSFLHNSFAKTPLTSLFYMPTVVKEHITLNKYNEGLSYIDYRMFLSAKRLYELELWGHEMPIFSQSRTTVDALKEIKDINIERTLLWELKHSENNWESVLSRYVRNFNESMNYIETSNEDNQWKIRQKFLLNEYILNHRQRFANLLSGSKMSAKNKFTLGEMTDSIFEFILSRLQLPDLRQSVVEYTVPAVDEQNTKRDLYVMKKDFEELSSKNFSLNFNGYELHPSIDQPEEAWKKLDTEQIDFEQTGKIKLVIRQPKNLMNNAKFMTIETEDSNIPLTTLSKEIPQLKWRNSLLWKVENWKPESYYLLSFEYRAKKSQYPVKIYEETIKNNKKSLIELVFGNQLTSSVWNNYQAVIKSSKDGKTAYLQIGDGNQQSPLDELEIKNISLLYLPHPKIILKTNAAEIKGEILPNVSFMKINPTKYKLNIENNNKPFYLVFNQQFNNRWKLFYDGDSKPYSPVVQSYFASSVKEAKQKDSLFDDNFLETLNKKSVLEENHFSVNGYANAWYIDPKKLSDKNYYSLILEMTTQRYFYIGAVISLITFLCLLIYFGYNLLHNKK